MNSLYNFDILSPDSLDEALSLMEEHRGVIKPLAGGTDVLVMVRNNHNDWGETKMVLNLKSIQGLDFIREDDDFIEIGPLVTHSQVIESVLIQEHVPSLIKAVKYIGSPQIRNQGTVVGNVCRGSPASDTLGVLYAREAQVVIQSVNGEKTVPIIEFLKGPGRSIISENSLVTGLRVPKLSGYIGDYFSLRQRKALSILVVSLAVEAQFDDEYSCCDVRIALGAVAPTIVRAYKTEALLKNQVISEELIKQAVELVKTESSPISDLRSNEEYRRAMTGILLERFLGKIVDDK